MLPLLSYSYYRLTTATWLDGKLSNLSLFTLLSQSQLRVRMHRCAHQFHHNQKGCRGTDELRIKHEHTLFVTVWASWWKSHARRDFSLIFGECASEVSYMVKSLCFCALCVISAHISLEWVSPCIMCCPHFSCRSDFCLFNIQPVLYSHWFACGAN